VFPRFLLLYLLNYFLAVQRTDILVPDDSLTHAASAFEAEGWTISTGPLPRAYAGFWQSGWDVFGKACRRFHCPPSILPKTSEFELVILPTSFVGLGPRPSFGTEEYTQIESIGPNVYAPTSHVMAESIAHTHIRHAKAGTNFSLMLRSWASYFYIYLDFRALDYDEKDVQEFWRAINRTMAG
jgi:hypothetical protein